MTHDCGLDERDCTCDGDDRKLRSVTDDSHIRETVHVLEEALVDARAGKLAAVVIFADLKGEWSYRWWKSAAANSRELVGKMFSAMTDIVLVGKP